MTTYSKPKPENSMLSRDERLTIFRLASSKVTKNEVAFSRTFDKKKLKADRLKLSN